MHQKRSSIMILLFVTSCLFAGTVVGLLSTGSLQEIVARSPIICAGTFEEGASITKSKLNDHEAGSYWLVAKLAVDHVIKGTISTGTVEVVLQTAHFEGSLPESATNNLHVSYGHKRCVVFLEPLMVARSAYRLAQDAATKEPSFDSVLPASPRGPQSSKENLDTEGQLEAELIGAAETEDHQTALSAMTALRYWGRKSTKQEGLLGRLSRSANDKIASVAIAMRLERGDISVLPTALAYGKSHKGQAGEVAYALVSIHDPSAIPSLTEFLKSADVEQRRGAMRALRSLANKATEAMLKPVFRAGLDDTDKEVQYHAMIGLSFASVDSRGFRVRPIYEGVSPQNPLPSIPGYSVFMEDPDPQKYINDWKKYESEMDANHKR
jgi:hypothetical protein